jgi:hypothetical protein
MAGNKTQATEASVDDYIAASGDEERRKDCQALVKLMTRVTKQKPKMWGPSIVGFGSYHYKYDSGREGDSCLTGFASRKAEIVVYLVARPPVADALLGKLGKHKSAKACLYIRRLADVDLKVLEQVVAASVAEVRKRYG